MEWRSEGVEEWWSERCSKISSTVSEPGRPDPNQWELGRRSANLRMSGRARLPPRRMLQNGRVASSYR